MSAFLKDIRYALRGLAHAPSFTGVSVLTLALGIGATTVAFTLVNGILLLPLPFPEPHRLVYLMEESDGGRELMLSYPNFDDWRTQATSLQDIAAVQFPSEVTVQGGQDPARARVLQVSREFFRVLDVQPLLGRAILPQENRPGGAPVAVVSYEFWDRALGGKKELEDLTLTLFGRSWQVVGVMPPGFRVLEEADLYLPMELSPVQIRSAHNYRGIGRISSGATLARAREEITGIAARIKSELGDETDAVRVALRPLRDQIVGEAQRPLFLLLGAAGLLLLIACTNQASTLLARATHRQREMAIRTAVGAGRGRLMRQLLSESLLLAGLGGGLGLGLTFATLRTLKALGPDLVPRLDSVGVAPSVLAFSFAATLATAILFGLAPALRSSRDVAGALRAGQQGGGRGRRAAGWSLLVGGEVALAVVLVVGSALLVRSLREILTLDTNFRAEGVLTLEMDVSGQGFDEVASRTGFFRDLESELGALPGVDAVGLISRLPTDPGTWTGPVLRSPVRDRGNREEWVAVAGWRVTEGSYFRAMGIPLLQGRTFSPEEDHPDGTPVAILNHSLAERAFPGEDPIGKQVQALWDREGRDFTVVGVVAEARDWRREAGAQPELYVYWPQALSHTGWMTAVIHTDGDPVSLAAPTRERIRGLAPGLPPRIETMEARLADSLKERSFLLSVLGAFATLSIVLASVGIYGVVSYSVSRRAREIGIRLALGANPRSVRTGVFTRALGVVAAGTGVGLLAAWALGGVMESLLFGVTPRDPVALASAPLVLLVVGALAILVPVHRHTRVDPVMTMKAE
jgi:predicted permease